MSTRIATATLALTTDPTQFNRGMKDTEDRTKSLKSQFEGLGYSAKGISSNFTSMAGSFLTANLAASAIVGTITTGFTAVKNAVLAVTKEAADYGDQIRDAGIRTGLTTQTLAGLKLMAEQNGASFEDLSTGLKFLSKNFIAATEGGKEQQEAFAKLGISVKDLKAANGNLEPVMKMVMDRLKEMPEGANKTAIELALLGKAGDKLTETFSQGSESLKAYMDLTRLLGLEVTPEAAANADAFNDSINRVDQAMKGYSVTVGNELTPALTELSDITTAAIMTGKDYTVQIIEWGKAAKITAEAMFGTRGLGTLLAGFLSAIPGASQVVGDLATNYGRLQAALDKTAASERAADSLRKMALEAMGQTTEAVKARTKAIETSFETAIRFAKEEARVREGIEDAVADAIKFALNEEVNERNAAYAAATRAAKESADERADIEEAYADVLRHILNQERDDIVASYAAATRAARESADERAEIEDAFDDVTKHILNEQSRAAESYQRVWEHAAGNVTSSLAEASIQAIRDWKNAGHTMVSLAIETAAGMAKAIISGFFAPVAARLASFGASLFGGGGGGGIGGAAGAAGGLLGKGGLFGGAAGSGLSLGTWGGTQAMAGGTLTTAPSGLLGGMHALLTNPWTAVVAGGIIGVTAWMKSQAHHEANTWVQKYQNPFDAAMATARSLNEKHGLVAGYLANMKSFAGMGSDEHLAATQARGTFLENYGDPRRYGVTMPVFHMGTPYVQHTGPAIVQQGERITSAKDNEQLVPLLQRMCSLLERTAAGLQIDGKSVSRIVGKHMVDLARNREVMQPEWSK